MWLKIVIIKHHVLESLLSLMKLMMIKIELIYDYYQYKYDIITIYITSNRSSLVYNEPTYNNFINQYSTDYTNI